MRTIILRVSALALAISGVAAAQTPVINTPDFTSAGAFAGFGANGVPTAGQTFTVPVGDTFLNSFSFYLANDELNGGGADLVFKPYLMTWAGDHPSGVNLLGVSPATAGNGSTYAEYLFNVGMAVTAGDVYVAFLTTSGVAQNGDGNGFNQFAGSNTAYAGGELVYAFTAADGSDITAPGNWTGSEGGQLGFNAQFSGEQSTVPEPSEFVLLGSGLSGLIGLVRIRRKRAMDA